MELSTETRSRRRRARWLLGLATLAAYGVLLLIWFRDPGRPEGNGFLLRSRTPWPAALVFLFLFALWIRARWDRASELGRQLWSSIRLGGIDAAILAGILLVAVAFQAAFFVHPGGVIDSDSVLPGIIAKHISDGRPAPAFIYERQYGGTFSAHLLAALYLLAGQSVVGLLVVTRFFYFLFVVAEYLLLRAAFGRGVALATCLWLAVPPHFFLTQLTYVEFPEILALAAIAVLLVSLRATDRVTENSAYTLVGFLFGIGFWTQPLITPIALASALGVGLLRGLPHLLVATRRAGLGFAIGVLPALVGWGSEIVVFGEWLAGGEEGGVGPSTPVFEAIAGLWRQGLPVAFGPYAEFDLPASVATAITLAIVGPALWAVGRGLRSHRLAKNGTSLPAAAAVLLGLAVLVHLGVFLASPWGGSVMPPRYLLPLYVGVPALIALAIHDLVAGLTRRSALGNYAAVVVMVAWLGAGAPASIDWMGDVAERHDNLVASVEELNARGIRFCEGPYWDAYWLTFFTLEEIICAPSHAIRDPYYRAALEQNLTGRFPILVASHGSHWLERPLESAQRYNYPHELSLTPTFQVLRIDVEDDS